MNYTERYNKAQNEVVHHLKNYKREMTAQKDRMIKMMSTAKTDEEAKSLHEALAIIHIKLDMLDELIDTDNWPL